MIITPIKTSRITSGSIKLTDLLDEYIPEVHDESIVVIASKIVALCEGRTALLNTDREELIKQESDYYLPAESNKYGHHFAIIRNTIVGSAGIDMSNSGSSYVLWPADPQASANQIRAYLMSKFDLKKLGVIIADSVSVPMRLGAIGATIGYSGFKPVNDYVGTPDLFGRTFRVERANIAGGLAAAAAVAMGEGAEQTPLVIIEGVPMVEFCSQDPSPEELASVNLSLEDDLFAPFFANAPWQKGGKKD